MAVQVEGLRKQYGEAVAVDGLDFEVREGEVFGLLGANGAGKTTAVECVSGLRTPDAGRVSVFGLDPWTERDELREILGVQLQDSRLPDALRVREALALYRSFYSSGMDVDEMLVRLGLGDKQDTPFAKLSGGQKQRLSIALALVGRPQIAILDELTTGLDPHARRDVWAMIEQIREGGVTIILVTHFMDEAELLCDRVAILDRGRIVAEGRPRELAESVSTRRRVRFNIKTPFDARSIASMDDVDEISFRGQEVEVVGGEDTVFTVMSELGKRGLVPRKVWVEQPTLEDAYLALTAADRRDPE